MIEIRNRNVFKQGAVHRVFNATSNWLAFDQALEKNKTCWTKNQYPEEWSSKVVNQTLEKIISGGKDQLRTTPKMYQKSKTKSIDKPTIFLQYRGNLTPNFASKLKKLRVSSSFYNAEIKIVPPHPEIIFR